MDDKKLQQAPELDTSELVDLAIVKLLVAIAWGIRVLAVTGGVYMIIQAIYSR